MSSYMRMVFEDHFVHGDLHPGNIMLHLDPPRVGASVCTLVVRFVHARVCV